MAEDKPNRLRFNYLKSNFFRVIHVDGAFGGVGPTGMMQIAVYNDRFPIPQVIANEIDDEGHVGPEVERIGRRDIVREVEVELVMHVEAAKTLGKWLLDNADKAIAQSQRKA